VREPLILREIGIEIADVVVVVRLGTRTLEDDHLDRATAEAHGRWGIWGFSVLEVPGATIANSFACGRSSRPAAFSFGLRQLTW
jgi:hypothetical protein